jgi:3-oxoacid CoA-transferase subunit A/glutaconate CoA-transferase subunit A
VEGELEMRILEEGEGKLIGWHDPDEQRKWVLENKPRELIDKQVTVEQAVSEYIKDGSLLAIGGFGHVRVPMSLIYEIIRQRRKNLKLAAKTAVHDSDLLIAAGCVSEIEVAYAFGHELRGLSPASRRAVEKGDCRVVAEISNAAYQWRFLAGMMGIPFIPSRNMLGTDTVKKSSAKVVEDPYSRKPICLLPAIHPDVAIVHVHRCDKYGNAQIDGTVNEDVEITRASRRVILTTENIVPIEQIRAEPWKTVIPYYVVDAVTEVPNGAHPCNMTNMYYFDEEHIAEWLDLSKSPEGAQEYFDKYVYGVGGFDEYLELIGGSSKLNRLQKIEHLESPLVVPWAKKEKR